jgi:hypothetical protein
MVPRADEPGLDQKRLRVNEKLQYLNERLFVGDQSLRDRIIILNNLNVSRALYVN